MMGFAFKEIAEAATRPLAECPLGKLVESRSLSKPMSEYDKPLAIAIEKVKGCPVEGNNGHWEGERGDSKWCPDRDHVPEKSNPSGKTMGEILDKYGIDGITYKDGQPDFGVISKGTVEIESFTDDRRINFRKADEQRASETGVSTEEVEKYRYENKYTWHECSDMKTMQLVPSEVHSNFPHYGGVAEAKKAQGGNQ